jgi:hypothetical protein
MITWIRYYRAQPDRDAELAPLLRPAADPVLGTLSAEGKVRGWGIGAPLSQNDDWWTHLAWIDFANWGAVDGFVDTLVGAQLPAAVARDVFLRHTVEPDAPSTVRPRYVAMHMHWIKRGHEDDALALFHEWARPLFVELAAAGKVGAWAQMMEDTAVTGDWRCLVRYPITDLSVLDDVMTSLPQFEMPRLKGFEIRLREMSERNYRGQILRVLHSAP